MSGRCVSIFVWIKTAEKADNAALLSHTAQFKMISNFQFKRIRTGIIALMLMALALLLLQHWNMMLSNSDDPWITRATMVEIHQAASAQGRFWLIPVKLMAQVPYQLDGWEVANLIKMMTNALVFFSFVFFCVRLTNVVVGLLMGLVWLALIDVSPGEYSPFHGFLWMFNLQFAALFFSFSLYLKYLDGIRTTKIIVWPFAVFGFSLLAYEPMLFYAGVFPLLFLYRFNNKKPLRNLIGVEWLDMAKGYLKSNFVLALIISIYLITYFGYRTLQPIAVRGLDISGTFWTVLKTTYLFSINGLHTQFNPFSHFEANSLGLLSMGAAVLYGFCLSFGVFLLLPKLRLAVQPRHLTSIFGIGVLIFFTASPNILLSLTAGYQKWAEFDPHYVGSYFSSFPLAMLISLLIMYLVGGEKAKHERVLFVAVLFVLFSSAVDNYIRWAQLATQNRAGAQLWAQGVDYLKANRTALTSSKDNPPTICGAKLPLKVKGDDVYWGRYLTQQLGQTVLFIGKPSPNQVCAVKLDFDKFRYPPK